MTEAFVRDTFCNDLSLGKVAKGYRSPVIKFTAVAQNIRGPGVAHGTPFYHSLINIRRSITHGRAYPVCSEKAFGKKASKKRKIYNGMLKTEFYQFPGPKPPMGRKI